MASIRFSHSRSRTLRLGALGAAVAVAFATTSAAASRWHDPKMDNADAAAEKALLLLTATTCGGPDDKSLKLCEKSVAKAIEELTRSREDIAAAAAAADGVTPLPQP